MTDWVHQFLVGVPPAAVYALVGLVIGVESLGIPLPGEIILVTAALLSAHHDLAISPVGVAVFGSMGAIVGDSIGYAIGRRHGDRLFTWLGARWPHHFGPDQVGYGRHVFRRHGAWTVFFGRFVALLRILSGPLAGALRMRYSHFLAANALGGIVWCAGTTFVVYSMGLAAEKWLSRFSWLALLIVVGIGLVFGRYIGRTVDARVREFAEQERNEQTEP